MRRAAMAALLGGVLLAGCSPRQPFDDRYRKAEQNIAALKNQIDAELPDEPIADHPPGNAGASTQGNRR